MPVLPPLHQLVVTSYSWFSGLPESIQDAMKARAQIRQLVAGERLYARGDERSGFYGVLSGAVRISGTSAEGHDLVLDFYGPGVWFGEVAMLDGMPRSNNADAYEKTSLFQIAPCDFEHLLDTHPALSRSLLRLEAQRLRIMLTALEMYSAQSLEQRLANRLLMLAGQYGISTERGLKIQLHLPQEILAQLIGATRQRVNQILKEWEEGGLVNQRYGRTLLVDQVRLEQIAQYTPPSR